MNKKINLENYFESESKRFRKHLFEEENKSSSPELVAKGDTNTSVTSGTEVDFDLVLNQSVDLKKGEPTTLTWNYVTTKEAVEEFDININYDVSKSIGYSVSSITGLKVTAGKNKLSCRIEPTKDQKMGKGKAILKVYFIFKKKNKTFNFNSLIIKDS